MASSKESTTRAFDFLTLADDACERELRRGLIAHIRQFLLELGAGFAFVGENVHLEVGILDAHCRQGRY